MAQLSGTTATFDSAGLREDLEDVIWDLFPNDTWALSNLDRVDATAVNHEWQLDTLDAATQNKVVEGDDASYLTVSPPTRVGNYTQIARKTFIISGTLEAVKKAGRKSEVARQAMKKMRELKRDMEKALVGNQGSSAGADATPRSCGGMEAWIPSTANGGNALIATTTASGASTAAFTSGVVAAPVDGSTTGALSLAIFNQSLGEAWADGGDPRMILVNTTQKTAIDAFTSIATRFVDVDRKAEAVIHGAANVYVSDYGVHTVMLHRYMRTSVVLCLDPDYWATAFLRRPKMEELAKTGDGEKRQIISEFTLISRNHNASAKVVACA
jgi:hypothetical protein